MLLFCKVFYIFVPQNGTVMKTKYIISIILFLISFHSKSFSQITATGTASAEIVELASLSPATVNEFNLSQNSQSVGLLKMGEIKIDSGTNVECSVILRSTDNSVNQNDNLKIEPLLENGKGSASVKGSKIISISGITGKSKNLSPGLYKGSYSVTLAFN